MSFFIQISGNVANWKHDVHSRSILFAITIENKISVSFVLLTQLIILLTCVNMVSKRTVVQEIARNVLNKIKTEALLYVYQLQRFLNSSARLLFRVPQFDHNLRVGVERITSKLYYNGW